MLPESVDSMTRSRYSLEYVFSVSSMPNIFIDQIRAFAHKTVRDTTATGLMALPEDRLIFTKYLRILCKELCGLLQAEQRLVKLNAPAIVVGDLQGSLHDLLQIERHCFQAFPVVPENLIFLGQSVVPRPIDILNELIVEFHQATIVALSRTAPSVSSTCLP